MRQLSRINIWLPVIVLLAIPLCITIDANAQAGVMPQRETLILNAKNQLSEALLSHERAVARVQEFEDRLQPLQKALDKQYETEIKLGVSLESYAEVIRNLQTHRVELTIELAGLDAKRELLTKKPPTKQAPSSAKKKLLSKIHDRQADQLEQLKILAGKGMVSKSEIAKAEIELAKNKLRIEEAYSKPTTESAIQNLAFENALERAEKKARLQAVEKLLAEFPKARIKLTKREQLIREMDTVRRRAAKEFDKANDLQEKVDAAKAALQRLIDSPDI